MPLNKSAREVGERPPQRQPGRTVPWDREVGNCKAVPTEFQWLWHRAHLNIIQGRRAWRAYRMK